MSDVVVEIANEATHELVDAMARLVPQLSSSSPAPTAEELHELVTSPACDLLVARLDGRIVKTVRRAPFQLLIRKPGGIHRLSARVVFTDGTPARTINFRFRICEPAVRALPPVTG